MVHLNNFPIYYLLNLTGSVCASLDFSLGEALNVYVDNVSVAVIAKTDTNEQCLGNGGVQVVGDFRVLSSVDPQNSTLRTLDEDGNTHEIKHGPGCENASSKIGQSVYLGTGWQEDHLYLAGGVGSCEILNSQIL